MRRERAVEEPRGSEQPPFSVDLHYKWIGPRVGVHPHAALFGGRVRRPCPWEIGDIAARPLLSVPPDILLSLAPGRAVGPGRGAVIENSPVRRPRIAPIEVRPRAARGVGLPALGAVLLWLG